MTLSITECVNKLTVNVRDLAHKPNLRPVLTAELLKLGYEADSVEAKLNEVFKVTLQ